MLLAQAAVRGVFPVRHDLHEFRELERLAKDPASARRQRQEELGVRAPRYERHATGQRWVVGGNPAIKLDPTAVTEPDVEQRAREVAALSEGQLRVAHTLDRHDLGATRRERAANQLADDALVVDMENRHSVA